MDVTLLVPYARSSDGSPPLVSSSRYADYTAYVYVPYISKSSSEPYYNGKVAIE
jgi:hypothetical protein